MNNLVNAAKPQESHLEQLGNRFQAEVRHFQENTEKLHTLAQRLEEVAPQQNIPQPVGPVPTYGPGYLYQLDDLINRMADLNQANHLLLDRLSNAI